ncbi:MAG: hypothetical protein QGG36_32620, partial [Pirellulaceae bacterium]|nr:hypothetical protein [Pirellulaceae bacterium]
MTGAVLLMVLGIPAVDHEWRQNDRGELECVIHLERVLLKALLAGDVDEIDSGRMPDGDRQVRYRIVVGEYDESSGKDLRFRPNQDGFSARGGRSDLGDAARTSPVPVIRAEGGERSRFSERAPGFQGVGDQGAAGRSVVGDRGAGGARANDGGVGARAADSRFGAGSRYGSPAAENRVGASVGVGARPRTLAEWIAAEQQALPLRFDAIARGDGLGIDGPLSAPVIRVGRQDDAPPLLDPSYSISSLPTYSSPNPPVAGLAGTGSQTRLEPPNRYGDASRYGGPIVGASGAIAGETNRQRDLLAQQAGERRLDGQSAVDRQLQELAAQQRELARQQAEFNRQRELELQRLRYSQVAASTPDRGGDVRDVASGFPFAENKSAPGSRFTPPTSTTGSPTADRAKLANSTSKPGEFSIAGGSVEPASHTVGLQEGDELTEKKEASAEEEKPWGLLGAVCA